MKVERRISLPVPVEKAWVALVDWEGQARWMVDADRIEVISPERRGVGTAVAVKTRVLGVPAFTERLEVTVWEPPAKLVMAHRSFVHGTGTWALEEADAGSEFIWTEELTLAPPLIGELLLLGYKPFMSLFMKGSMERLRRVLGG